MEMLGTLTGLVFVFRMSMNASQSHQATAFVALAFLFVVVGCQEEAGTDISSAAPTTSSPSSSREVSTTAVTTPDGAATTSQPANTTLPQADGVTEIWHYASSAIGREFGRGDDFASTGGLVAALRADSRDVAVLDLDSGDELWQVELPDQSGTILGLAAGVLTWATYDQVGAYSADGESLWEHRFDDDRWPSQAAFRDDLTVVALNPTMEGDMGPPRVVQFDQSGSIVWSVELTDSRPDEDLQWGGILLADDGVIIQTTEALYQLDWATGAQEWRVPFSDADIETFTQAGLLHDDGVVYGADTPGAEGEILGVDTATGETRTAIPTGSDPRLVGVVDRWLVYTDEAGVHAAKTSSDDTWHADLPGARAVVDEGKVVAVAANTLVVLNPNGDEQSQLVVDTPEPQPQPVTIGQVLLVPGWERTEAIDTASGQTLMTWQGESTSNVLPVDDQRALIGVAGDGIYLVATP